jgi:flavin reductase (DIM6/NTAB) family NADH-FMN oxidoreductase RutF
MSLLATGVTVITTRINGSIHGMTASAVTSVSLDPLLMLAAIERRTTMCNIIRQAGEFAINILSERQEDLSRHFARANTRPQPASLRFESDPDDGAPYISDTLAAIRCRVELVLDGGDHVIVLGRVVHFHDGPRPRRCSTTATATGCSATQRRLAHPRSERRWRENPHKASRTRRS